MGIISGYYVPQHIPPSPLTRLLAMVDIVLISNGESNLRKHIFVIDSWIFEGMSFGLDKCHTLHIERGKVVERGSAGPTHIWVCTCVTNSRHGGKYTLLMLEYNGSKLQTHTMCLTCPSLSVLSTGQDMNSRVLTHIRR